ncbi:TIR domain-containing protein [Ornithinimicrobium sp. Y1847]|uniref:TIR domain-containing protein n=1 Tax=Ornithinimicrobium sp. Y1847 TaxID=3405419 RepID=UPI003B677EF8
MTYQHEVALSFAGEQREYVQAVVDELKKLRIEPFYDNDYGVELWGKSHLTELPSRYRNSAMVVMFISKDYVAKAWPKHEASFILHELLDRTHEYLLPVRFDDAELEGLDPSIHYQDANKVAPGTLASAIESKLVAMGLRPRKIAAKGQIVSYNLLPRLQGGTVTLPPLEQTRDPKRVRELLGPYVQLADDLVVIARETGAHVPMPLELNDETRVWVRVLRRMLEGGVPPWPIATFERSLVLTASAVPTEGALFVRIQTSNIMVGEHAVALPPFGIYHPHVRFTDPSPELDTFGRPTGRHTLTAAPVDGTPLVAYIAAEGARTSTPWDLEGITEPPELALPE